MYLLLRGLRSADSLSTKEHLHLKGYTTEFLYGEEKIPNDLESRISWPFPSRQ